MPDNPRIAHPEAIVLRQRTPEEAQLYLAAQLVEKDAEIQRLRGELDGHRLVIDGYQGLVKHLEGERDQARADADVAVKQAWSTRQELVRVKAELDRWWSQELHDNRRARQRAEAALGVPADELSISQLVTALAESPVEPGSPPGWDAGGLPCDWGGCNRPSIGWRWATEMTDWLPVCGQCMSGAPASHASYDEPGEGT
jgi:hypothetical protein